MLIKKYLFGETAVYYVKNKIEGFDDKEAVGLIIYPADKEISDFDNLCVDSLIQVAFTGDRNLIDYTQGLTMRNRDSSILKIESQELFGDTVTTVLTDEKGNRYVHYLEYDSQSGVFAISADYINDSAEDRQLEMLSSFSLSGICSGEDPKKSTIGLTLHRMTSAWSRECRLKSDTFAHLGLDMSWGRYGVKCEKWGERGSMPVRDYFPFGAIEDKKEGIITACMLQAPYSWQMEVYQEKETCAFSGGLGDYEFAHWRKKIAAGESFSTYKAYIKVARGGVNEACNSILKYMDSLLCVPKDEESMPILFNEYCTTWGCPSEDNICEILKAIRPLPIDTFVIDCGWYKPDDKGWCNATGDWVPSKTLFPHGVKAVVDKIRSDGKRAGIWFEFEVAGIDSRAYYNEDMLIKRDGYPLSTKNRRFFDLRKDSVKEYLNERMLRFLSENGFGYIKIDYNDNIGVGCDSSPEESVGEGGRQLQEESIEWLEKLKQAVPDIVIENCSSGGSRIEPLRMSKVSMCSFSDAHECNEIPLVAANVSRIVPARQSQIWAVIRESDSDERIIWSITSAMIGRICLSGDIWKVSEEKIKLINSGLCFYNNIKDIVRYGDIKKIDCSVEYYRNPLGRQIYLKTYNNRALLLVHNFIVEEDTSVDISGYKIKNSYASCSFKEENGILTLLGKSYSSAAFELEKIN